MNDFSITPEQIIDRYDYEFSTYEYALDAYPNMPMHKFGANILAAFLGAEVNNNEDIYTCGMEKWRGLE